MKKILSFMLAACVALFASCGADSDGPSTLPDSSASPGITSKKTIVIVTTGEGGSFWENIIVGAEEAAKKLGCNIEVKGQERNELFSPDEQNSLIKEALENGADGLIFSAVGDGVSSALKTAFDEKIPVVELGKSLGTEDSEDLTKSEKNPVVSRVFTDEKGAGALCADSVFSAFKDEIKSSGEKIKIGVVYKKKLVCEDERAAGFEEKLSELSGADDGLKDKLEVIKKDVSEDDVDDALESLKESGAKLIFLCSENAVDEASDEIYRNPEEYKGIFFCGFDSGKKQLKWMKESNAFLGSVARDAYNMGFNAVLQVVSEIEGEEVKPEVDIGAHWYTKDSIEKMKQDKVVYD